jgi:4-carboxymuconolactone decarboxylase
MLAPADLSTEQRSIYEEMRTDIGKEFSGIQKHRGQRGADGTLESLAVHEPKFGKPIWDLGLSLSVSPSLPRCVREVAILVTGAKFHSSYALYAHVMAAERCGLSDDKLATIVAGQRPGDLTREETIAYDLASALVQGGVLPELSCRQAIQEFGQHGAAELIYLVGLYCLVSVTLNAFDVPVPESDAG